MSASPIEQLVRGAAAYITTNGGSLAGLIERVSARDGLAVVRLGVPDRATRATLAQWSDALTAAVRERSASTGLTAPTLAIEWVDHSGEVVHRAGSSPPAGPAQPAAPSQPTAAARTAHAPTPQDALPPASSGGAFPGIRRAIAVGAGKGGVGKSTIAVNLAVGLARRGRAVGILDADIYGPSLPTLLGLDGIEVATAGDRLLPFLVHGIKATTLGKLVDPGKPLIWRGPMAHGAFKQLLDKTEWGELDDLIIDLPPGTGDVALTMAQSLRLTGAVVVCTPQKVAQDDASRAVSMFRSLGVEVLGVVENMSSFIAEDISPPREYDIFGKGGAERMAQRLGVPFLGRVPMTIGLRVNSDRGEPLKNFDRAAVVRTDAGVPVPTTSALPDALDALVHALEGQLALASLKSAGPTLSLR